MLNRSEPVYAFFSGKNKILFFRKNISVRDSALAAFSICPEMPWERGGQADTMADSFVVNVLG